MTKQEMAPYVPENGHDKGNGHNHDAVSEENKVGGLSGGQVVDRPFYDHGDQELKKVHEKKAENPKGQVVPVLDEIFF